jgi:23S rRNA (guanosine2251-2'-O)-methyltransferase
VSGGKKELGGERVPGRRAVRELLVAGRRPVRRIWMARGQDSNPVLEEIVELASAASIPVDLVDAERVRTEAQVDAPQGIVAHAAPVPVQTLDQLLTLDSVFLVAFDGVTDPRNLGAALRTAEAAGATGAVLPRHRGALLTPAAMKAAAGAAEHLPIAVVAGVAGALEHTARAGVWSVGLDEDGTTSVFELPVADAPIVLVLGAEGTGLSQLVKRRCDVVASIPLHGHIESLNVAAAAAVACFEVARHRVPSEKS